MPTVGDSAFAAEMHGQTRQLSAAVSTTNAGATWRAPNQTTGLATRHSGSVPLVIVLLVPLGDRQHLLGLCPTARVKADWTRGDAPCPRKTSPQKVACGSGRHTSLVFRSFSVRMSVITLTTLTQVLGGFLSCPAVGPCVLAAVDTASK